MSRSKLHKDKGKFNNGLLDIIPDKLQNLFNRHNWEIGERRKAKKDLINKIAKKELQQQLKTDEYNFKKDGEFIEDIDDPYYTTRCKTYIPTTATSKRCSICGELKYNHEK